MRFLSGHSTSSLPVSVQVNVKETPSPQPPASFSNNGQLEPKVITAALASSPKLFQKTEKTVNIPAAFVLTPKSSPAPTPPRTPSPSPSTNSFSQSNGSNGYGIKDNHFSNGNGTKDNNYINGNSPSRPSRRRTPPVPPPRTSSSLLRKLEIEANMKVRFNFSIIMHLDF